MPHYRSRHLRYRIARAMLYLVALCVRRLCPALEASAMYLGPLPKGGQLWATVWAHAPKHFTEEEAISRWRAHQELDRQLEES